MSTILSSIVRCVQGNPSSILTSLRSPSTSQIRHKWADWRMAKDVRKRKAVSQFADEKLRINAMRRNDILPKEIKEIADVDLHKLPNDCLGKKIVSRCALTSRPRGNVLRWRVSRIMFRHFADYNKIAGIQRARW